MAKHTPGPWEVVNDAHYYDGVLLDVVPSGGGHEGFGIGYDTPENRANARLIAAAPELLEQLEWLVKFFDAEPNDDQGFFAGIAHHMPEFRALLARIEGED